MTSLPVNAYDALAQARMEQGAYAYVAGGAGDGACVARNLAAWRDLMLCPKLMRPMADMSTARHVFGLDLAFPCLIAPMAFQRLADPLGEQAMAMAAKAQGAGMILSCQTSVEPEQAMAQPFWFQVYFQRDMGQTRALIDRAAAAGATAVVVTLDAPLNGVRNQERAAHFTLPKDVAPVMLPALSEPMSLAQALAQAPSWEDLAALCANSALPVLAKGILNTADATHAVDCGCAGVIVSNHGGRVLEGLPATADILPAIRAALPDTVLLVDGGLRSGEDLFRAMALGADAACIGRPAFFALAAHGAVGVASCLRRLHDELCVTMGLMGTTALAEITSDFVLQPSRI
ncbi:hypothetical protein BFP70_10410 [Thioclava sp. SK-1]|uniref:alpha-hydroxy acid oxidase n=1 Tax=Thioclava sp. SK-1 TaxID=1889770 RepID=UPI000823FB7C|nr:alpha-hydroxy acid oxidase [Thioclava sp. SK-1]OCX64457.1 hypothetical protein BFP70_10410 [Thioclava sp. SK-1]